MKKARLVVCSALLSLFMLTAVVYTSCTKSADTKTTPPTVVDKCLSVVCQNTGTCTNGICTCPTGYSGTNCEQSRITFKNNAPTPVTVVVNDTNYTVPTGDSTHATHTSGSSATISAHIQDISGDTLFWHYTLNFPNNGILLSRSFDIPVNYFYLKIVNTATLLVTKLIINLSNADETFARCPTNDGIAHGVGYFKANAGMSIGVLFIDGSFKTFPTTVTTGTLNQVYTLNLN